MNVTVLCDEKDDVVSVTDLHGYGKIVLGFRWKEDIDGSFLERLVAGRRLTDFNHMKLKKQDVYNEETTCLSVCPVVCLSVCLSVLSVQSAAACPVVCRPSVCLSVCPIACLSVCLFVRVVCPSVCPVVCLSVCLSLSCYLSVMLSVCLSCCLSVCLSVPSCLSLHSLISV